MNRFNDAGEGRAGRTDPAVLWATYEADGFVHAVADVPNDIPKATLGVAATDTEATVFVGTPAGPHWTVALPAAVNPTPVAVSYNNGVVEVVFSEAVTDPLDAVDDAGIETM
ncbi:hypothetical protein [Halorubellus sp. PRR65]|uniref:hypothetical protein n=1 Tax=Halorubellus sp. PRR65 TaxID=3098148 RepID=UPI002B26193A|nr:hypothetical protein [Halorubellus sp. PRR65]